MIVAGAAALGLALGSFIGVALDRVPAAESIVTGRSRCRSCGRTLNALDLVPVAGYLVRRGRCAGCGARIPVRYPLLELGCGLVMLTCVAIAGPWAGGAVGLAALAVLTTAGLTLELRRRPR